MIYISSSQSQQNILNVHNHHQIIIITDKIKSVVFILPRVLTSSTGAGQQWYFGGGAGYQEYKETKTKSAVLLTSLMSFKTRVLGHSFGIQLPLEWQDNFPQNVHFKKILYASNY